MRSDNGLIFQSRRFRDACAFYGLDQEYITPYTPEQNGLIERWFRSMFPDLRRQLKSQKDIRYLGLMPFHLQIILIHVR
jgi:transposase InsO family protein